LSEAELVMAKKLLGIGIYIVDVYKMQNARCETDMKKVQDKK